MINSKNAEKKQNNRELDEAKNNLLGFFDLLLKMDMKNNPQKYIKKVKTKND